MGFVLFTYLHIDGSVLFTYLHIVGFVLQKRKAKTSLTEPDMSNYTPKYKKQEPPKLTHLDVSYDMASAAV